MTDASKHQSPQTPSQTVVLEDNARKFIVESLDERVLEGEDVKAYSLTTDWLEMNEASETKLAYKTYSNGDVQMLRIAKVTGPNGRTSQKDTIDETEYNSLLARSVCRVEKKRHEWVYVQNGTKFDVTYDVFSRSPLRILEVDAATDSERAAFDPLEFPATLTEVTGDIRYYGYRIADALI